FQILFRGGLKRDTDLVRDHPRDAISVAIAQAHDAADVADNAFCLQLSKGDDLRDAPLAVFLSHVSEDFAAASLTKIDIDVGRRDAIGIEEALKQKPELERIDVSNPEHIGNERPGSRPAAWPHWNPLLFREP